MDFSTLDHPTVTRSTLICKQILFCERLTWNPAECLVCDVSRQLNVLHQAASCSSCCDIRETGRGMSKNFQQPCLRCGVVYLRTPTEQLQTIEQGNKTLICISFTKLNIHLLLERVLLNVSGYSLTRRKVDLREDILLARLISSIHRYTDMFEECKSRSIALHFVDAKPLPKNWTTLNSVACVFQIDKVLLWRDMNTWVLETLQDSPHQ
ncbi:hypothetical protein CSKR_111579 [Clonorchis sinensis]|uniref:Uncharacterized protein n=1 Tax=Clonorchis sinensis TaxID=79923 RepID=A0A3R7F969_CLOSI|nr:hypothetical protein CSKR_111579 [Clonorchis sinensis]